MIDYRLIFKMNIQENGRMVTRAIPINTAEKLYSLEEAISMAKGQRKLRGRPIYVIKRETSIKPYGRETIFECLHVEGRSL